MLWKQEICYFLPLLFVFPFLPEGLFDSIEFFPSIEEGTFHCIGPIGAAASIISFFSLPSSWPMASASSSVLSVPIASWSMRLFVSITWRIGSSMYCQASPSCVLLPLFHGPRTELPFDKLKYRLLNRGSL